tara:strand:+ start:3496 stop:4962 length:1467 start_codon:yes stop_codon:yes gene_type:complete
MINNKKTILFFSRCQLAEFYGRISEEFTQNFEVLHIAYSNVEEKVLREEYNINQVINLQKEVSLLLKEVVVNDEIIEEIDTLIINQSNDRFSLNASIQADRTFKFISYEDSLKLSIAYYTFWDKFIASNNIDFLVHEPTSIFLNQIASLLCKKNNAIYFTMIGVYGENKYNWIALSGDDGVADELIINEKIEKKLSEKEVDRVEAFLNSFRKDNSFLYQKAFGGKVNFYKLIKSSLKLIGSFTKRAYARIPIKKNLINHVDLFEFKDFSFFRELKKQWNTLFFLKYDVCDYDANYYYYPLHYEPEAVVLYWGDSIYKNQVKLIENIAGQLPPNSFLYVKDHPHAGSYRDVSDYEKIQAIPNVKLLNPSVSGKNLIRTCQSLITINGTSGFEAVMFNKQVYTFGNAFYSPYTKVERIYNIRELRSKIYKHHGKDLEDDEELYLFIHNYLNSIHSGFVDYFINFAKIYKIDDAKNSKIVALELSKYFEKF